MTAEKPAAAASDADAPPTSRACPCEPCAMARLVMHDARTPLHAIRGFGELLLTGAGGPLRADALDYVQQVVRAARGLELALRHMQELVAFRHDEPTATPACALDLGALLAESCRSSGLDGEVEVPIVGDPASWRRIFQLAKVYLSGGEASDAGLPARLARTDGCGLELTLGHLGVAARDGTNLLAVELARRLAEREGARLTLAGPNRIVIAWPGS